MATPRIWHTATLLPDGRVLVTGGTANPAEQNALSSAEIYDPETDQWAETGSMNATRMNHQSVLLPDGRVLVVGGAMTNQDIGVEAWNPDTGEWSALGGGTESIRADASIVLPDGRVLVAPSGDAATVFDPLAGTWTATNSMVVGRYNLGFVMLLDGTVLAVGGDHLADVAVTTIEAFDPTTRTWHSVGELDGFHFHGGTLLEDGRILILNSAGFRVLLFDPVTGVAERVPGPLWMDSRPIRLDDGLLFFAGYAGAGIFDPASDSRLPIDGMPSRGFGGTLTLLQSGDVLLVGGGGADWEHPTAAVDLYERP